LNKQAAALSTEINTSPTISETAASVNAAAAEAAATIKAQEAAQALLVNQITAINTQTGTTAVTLET
jgi:hypothetical protein